MVFVTVKFVCGRVTVLENKSLFGFVHSWAWCYKLSGYEPTLPLPTSVGCVGKLSFLFLIFCHFHPCDCWRRNLPRFVAINRAPFGDGVFLAASRRTVFPHLYCSFPFLTLFFGFTWVNWSRTFAGFVLLKAVTDDAALGRLRNFFRALYPFFRFATRFCLLPHLTVLFIFFILFIMTHFILWLIIYCRVCFLPVPLLQLATFFAFDPRSVDTVSNFLDMLTLFRIIGNFCRPFTFHTSLFFISLLSVPWKWS